MGKARGTKSTHQFVKEREHKQIDSDVHFSHKLTIEKKLSPTDILSTDTVLKQKYQNLWFKKLVSSGEKLNGVKFNLASYDAAREVVAQEFFRLFIPNHPKTRLAVDEEGSNYVLSKEVPGFVSFQDMNRRNINTRIQFGVYHGLGDVLVMSLFMNEIDLKLGNIGIDKNGEIIKIDGDWCFANLGGDYKGDNRITSEVLDALPFNGTYSAYHWLDATICGKANIDPNIVHNLSNNIQFRNEVNRTILKILITPSEVIKNFISHYISDPQEIDKIYNEITQRKGQFEIAAYYNKSYQEFILTPAAQTIQKKHLEHLGHFQTTSKYLILDQNATLEPLNLHIPEPIRGELLIKPPLSQRRFEISESPIISSPLNDHATTTNTKPPKQPKMAFTSSENPQKKNTVAKKFANFFNFFKKSSNKNSIAPEIDKHISHKKINKK